MVKSAPVSFPEMSATRADHWDHIYAEKQEHEVSWFQERPGPSLSLIEHCAQPPAARILDVGGGASRLVDALVDRGFADVTVLDVSSNALAAARARLADRANGVHWLVQDVTSFEPPHPYDLWHDRAVFHFLGTPEERAAYVRALERAVAPGGWAVLATFALDGPERCSGLPVVRYDAEGLAAAVGPSFSLVESMRHAHVTPAGRVQSFIFVRLRRV